MTSRIQTKLVLAATVISSFAHASSGPGASIAIAESRMIALLHFEFVCAAYLISRKLAKGRLVQSGPALCVLLLIFHPLFHISPDADTGSCMKDTSMLFSGVAAAVVVALIARKRFAHPHEMKDGTANKVAAH